MTPEEPLDAGEGEAEGALSEDEPLLLEEEEWLRAGADVWLAEPEPEPWEVLTVPTRWVELAAPEVV